MSKQYEHALNLALVPVWSDEKSQIRIGDVAIMRTGDGKGIPKYTPKVESLDGVGKEFTITGSNKDHFDPLRELETNLIENLVQAGCLHLAGQEKPVFLGYNFYDSQGGTEKPDTIKCRFYKIN